jgi:1-acyl-sn-glycerol-3-phosphate acyltransferase
VKRTPSEAGEASSGTTRRGEQRSRVAGLRRASADLELPARLYLVVQREVSRLLSPLSLMLIWIALRFVGGYRIENLAEVRRETREIRARGSAPLLVCGNHLTMVDSFLIAWALGNPLWFIVHFSALPWNVPERLNFASKSWQKAVVYVLKCVPIHRGGRRSEVADVLTRVAHLLRKNESVLIFPEGGRSRSGRVEVDNAATGVGRVIRSVPDCRVLCVYLRGEGQKEFSFVPERGDRFYAAVSELEPKTDASGLRGSRELVRQVVRRLSEMETEYFDGRE